MEKDPRDVIIRPDHHGAAPTMRYGGQRLHLRGGQGPPTRLRFAQASRGNLRREGGQGEHR